MENPKENNYDVGDLEATLAAFTAAIAQSEAHRLADRVSEQFLVEFSRELSGERQVELLVKALAICLRSYAEHGCIEPKLESVLQDWWGNSAFRELKEALRLFARSAEQKGAKRERRKIRVVLPRLIEQRIVQGDRQTVVVCRRARKFFGAVGFLKRILHLYSGKYRI